jgi:DNA (cytosine-5)-methyltransferase 1
MTIPTSQDLTRPRGGFTSHVAPWARGIGEYPTYDEFSGAGGLSQGAGSVPGVVIKHAANHKEICVQTHAANYRDADHYHGDVRSIDVATFPYYPIFLAAPQCPPFTDASGKRRDFDRDTQGVLWEDESDAQTTERMRGRLLMHEVPRYLEGMALRGKLVLCGIVENVPQARKWSAWGAWIKRIKDLGYDVKVIALNSMHARPVRTRWAPQSRNRLYVAYWLKSLGRAPDWDKWLRPRAYCPSCDETVDAMQVFKKPGDDMGTYGRSGQYWYRCPHSTCRNRIIDPPAMPSGAIIDWSDPGTPIGERTRPIAESTRRRIAAGILKYAVPILAEVAGHTFERHPGVRTRPVTDVMPTQQCTATRGLCTPPLIVPTGGSWQDQATSATDPIATLQTRDCNGLAVAPFIVDHHEPNGPPRTLAATDPLTTVTSGGNKHSVVVPPFVTVLRNSTQPTSAGEPVSTISSSGAHHGLTVVPPFMLPLRGGDTDRAYSPAEPAPTFVANGSKHSLVVPDAALIMRNFTPRGDAGQMSTPVGEPVRTVTAQGNQSLLAWAWQHLLVPYYGTGVARGVAEPAGTVTSKDRFALASLDQLPIDLDEVLFRMLKPEEIAAAMAFADDYIVLGTREEQIMQYGNAVTPPVGEVIMSALMECISGVELPRELALAA